MSCNGPLSCWKNKNGKGVTFRREEAYIDMPLAVPCGQCYGCKLDRAKEWALRCWHESQLYDENSFVTLTYDENQLPHHRGVPSLRPTDFQLFMKRLRKHFARRKQRVRFFQCGEYGNLQRPHHHALLFNCGFADRELHRRTADSTLYRSPLLEKLWPHGFSTIGDVTFESAAYVAKYTLKKEPSSSLKWEINQIGQVRRRTYLTMSKRPGIGKQWLNQFKSDVYPSDECVTPSGYVARPPRFYDNQLPDSVLAVLTAARAAKLTPEFKSGLRQTAREKNLRAKHNLRRREVQ